MRNRQALVVCVAWMLAALAFDAGVFLIHGPQKTLEFLTGYVIEWSLSLDNLFVFYLIFSHFKVEVFDQGKILSWGVLGAQLMRFVFILGGVALLHHLAWVIYLFGLLLVFSGVKVFLKNDQVADLDQNSLWIFLKRFIPQNLSTFWIVLIAVELADLVFAVDSIPAVLAITKDPFIVYSSNIFAILGLRAMYMVFAPFIDKIQYLHYTLGIILVFVGSKMLLDHVWQMPVAYALGFIILVLSVFTIITLVMNKNRKSR